MGLSELGPSGLEGGDTPLERSLCRLGLTQSQERAPFKESQARHLSRFEDGEMVQCASGMRESPAGIGNQKGFHRRAVPPSQLVSARRRGSDLVDQPVGLLEIRGGSSVLALSAPERRAPDEPFGDGAGHATVACFLQGGVLKDHRGPRQ